MEANTTFVKKKRYTHCEFSVRTHSIRQKKSSSTKGKDGHSEAHEDEQVWDALFIVANEIRDEYLAVTLHANKLRTTESRQHIMKSFPRATIFQTDHGCKNTETCWDCQ